MNGLIGLWAGSAGALGASGAVLGWVARASGRMHHTGEVVERIERLLEPEGDAPGLGERLRALESGQRRIEAQLQPNGGASARDAINRLEAGLRDVAARLPPTPPP